MGRNRVKVAGAETCWESGVQISKDQKCPHCESAPKVYVPFEIWHRIMSLTKGLSTEWLGYLHATQQEDGSWEVTGITVPKQEVGAASVTPKETVQSEGVVHSHVGMKAFFSGTDDAYINENHDFSIVVNKSEEYAAVARLKLPCKALSIVDTEVEIIQPGVDVTAFIEEAKKNIEEKTYPLCTQPGKTPITAWNNRRHWDPTNTETWDVQDTGVPDYVPDPHPGRHYTIQSRPEGLTPQETEELHKLVDKINTDAKLSKKERKKLVRELASKGMVVQKDKLEIVRVELPDFIIDRFPVDGQLKGADGKTIIGRYCKTCQAFSNIREMPTFALHDQWTRLFECITCGSFEVEEITREDHLTVVQAC